MEGSIWSFARRIVAVIGDACPDLVRCRMAKAACMLFLEHNSVQLPWHCPGGGAASLPMRPLRSPDPNKDLFENQSAWI
jgi:hypothetical protein